jgi:hypothetical protein
MTAFEEFTRKGDEIPSLEEWLGADLGQRIRDRFRTEIPEAIQAELAAILTLLPRAIPALGETTAVSAAQAAIKALLSECPQLVFAQKTRAILENQLREARPSTWRRLLEPKSPTASVMGGLFFGGLLVLPIWVWSIKKHVLDEGHLARLPSSWGEAIDVDLAVLAICVGTLGSVISIMFRLRSFENMASARGFTLFLEGLFRPVIGAAFAGLSLALLASGLFAVPQGAAPVLGVVLALAFVAGFSERFDEELLGRLGLFTKEDKVPARHPASDH